MMARPVRGHPTPWPKGAPEEPETNPSVPQQEEQSDTREGKVIADFNPDVDYEPEGQILTSKQSMKKRKTLMQNM